jgi:hypothetical protein
MDRITEEWWDAAEQGILVYSSVCTRLQEAITETTNNGEETRLTFKQGDSLLTIANIYFRSIEVQTNVYKIFSGILLREWNEQSAMWSMNGFFDNGFVRFVYGRIHNFISNNRLTITFANTAITLLKYIGRDNDDRLAIMGKEPRLRILNNMLARCLRDALTQKTGCELLKEFTKHSKFASNIVWSGLVERVDAIIRHFSYSNTRDRRQFIALEAACRTMYGFHQ